MKTAYRIDQKLQKQKQNFHGNNKNKFSKSSDL